MTEISSSATASAQTEVANQRLVIVDYGAGNLFSVEQACRQAGITPLVTANPALIANAEALILPGVGAFGEAMASLRRLDLESPLRDFAQTGRPLLGVCLGLQLLFTESEEFGSHKGLNIVPGVVRRFSATVGVPVPQIAWNQIHRPAGLDWEDTLLKGTADGEYMYFVHSYYVAPEAAADILSETDYAGVRYCSSVHRGGIFATQFHPEKSAARGVRLYTNWLRQALPATPAA